MSLALLFPGQGVQHGDMLPWLQQEAAAAPALAALAARLGADWRQRCADEAWACSNAVAQTLITGLAQAAWAVLAPRLPSPSAVAGYSVGEVAALQAAGVFDADTALALAAQRASAMDACVGARAQGLVAVSGIDHARSAAVCKRFGVGLAIRIGAQSQVLGGLVDQLQAAAEALRDTPAKLTWLRVHIASHTALMAAAAQQMQTVVASMPWRRSACVVASGIDGVGRRDAAALKTALAGQTDSTLRWDLCMETLLQRQPRCVLEVGPGSSLARLWAAACPAVPCRSIDEFRSADAIVGWVQARL